MAKVPTYDAPQETLRALPTVRQDSVASADLLGGIAAKAQMAGGQAALAAGTEMFDVAKQMKQRENADLIFRAETGLKNDYLAFESDAKQKRGANAWGVTKDTEKFFADAGAKYSEGIEDPIAKRLFDQTVQRMRTQGIYTMSMHEGQERRASLDDSAQASIVGSVNLAAAAANQWKQPVYSATRDAPAGMSEAGNIDLAHRPIAQNEDGSISTVRSMSVNIEGKEVLIPTVVNGKVVSDDEAIANYKKTGQHLGKFDTPDNADGYANALHVQQEQMYANGAPVDPVTAAKQDIVKRVQVRAQLNGWSPERRAAEEQAQLTNLHTQVIQNLANQNPTKAKDYFDTYKGEIAGGSYDSIHKVIKQGSMRTSAQTFADSIEASGLGEADALVAARKKYEGEEEAAVVAEIKTRFKEKSDSRELMQKDAADTAFGIYARTGRISAIPADVMAKLDGKVLLALKKDAEGAATDKMPRTNWDAYYALRQSAFENPEAFAKRDLRQDFGALGKAEREGLIDLQTKVRKPAEAKDAASLEQQLSATYNILKLDNSSASKEMKGKLAVAVQAEVDQAQQQTPGKKLPQAERQKIIDRLVIEGAVPGVIFSSNKRLFEVQGTPDQSKFVPTIPDSDKDAIKGALRKSLGKNPTDAQVMEVYKRGKGIQ